MAFLSKTREQDLRKQLKYFENFTRGNGKITQAERVAINNLKFAICDLICMNYRTNGCYMDDLRNMTRTEYKFND